MAAMGMRRRGGEGDLRREKFAVERCQKWRAAGVARGGVGAA